MLEFFLGQCKHFKYVTMQLWKLYCTLKKLGNIKQFYKWVFSKIKPIILMKSEPTCIHANINDNTDVPASHFSFILSNITAAFPLQ